MKKIIFGGDFLFVQFFARFAKHLVVATVALTGAFSFAGTAEALIVQEAPPMDGVMKSSTISGGTVFPVVRFRMSQASGSDTLTKIGVIITASTTMTQGEISRISLWKDSGGQPDFQVDQDTEIAGAASSSPLVDGTLIVLQPSTPVSIGSTGTEFYIVASTTAVTGLVNGHAFNVSLQGNSPQTPTQDFGYASTSANTGLGTAFTSNVKLTLSQAPTLKISEVKTGSTGNAGDEFIELYNSGEAPINLKDLPLRLFLFNQTGGAELKTITYYKSVIPSHGFFLIASQTNYSGSVPPDAVYGTLSGFTLAANTGLAISTSSATELATSTAIDKVGWGTEAVANCESICQANLAESGGSIERVAIGYPMATSTASTMAPGGSDASKGNSYDSNNNSIDFVVQSAPTPQNSVSSVEFPFGGGGQDTSTLQVMGSYPNTGMTNVPIDMSFIGFGFNKPVFAGSIASASATTTVTLAPTAGGSNLCTSVTFNMVPGNFEPPAKCVLSARLTASTAYTFTVTTEVRDLSGNYLDQNSFTAGNQSYSVSFTTGGATQTSTNVTPPMVVGTSPFMGGTNIPRNLAKIAIEFNQVNMDTSTFNANNIKLNGPAGEVALSGFVFSTSTGKNILSATVGATLAANTNYSISVSSSVKNTSGTNGVNIQIPGGAANYISAFTTGNSSDTTAPAIVGILPSPGSTLSANTNDFMFTFDDNIDPTTITGSSVTLGIVSGANLPGTVSYSPVTKEGHFTASNVLPVGQQLVLTLVGATVKNVSGVALGTDETRNWTVEAVNNDTTPPSILFANGDDFGLAITFNEPINSTDAITLSNYTLSVGGTSQSLSSMAGHSLTYDASTRTVKLTGLRLAANSSFTVTVQNIKDISGNQMTSAGTFTGTVNSYAQSGGFVGPGSFSGSTFGEKKDFSSAGIGFVPPVNIKTQSTFVSATTTYSFDVPISKQVAANGTIVVTFPSSSDFNLCCVATTSSANPFVATQNKDINGPGPSGTSYGTLVGIKTITSNASAKTVTLTLDNPTRLENSDAHDFLQFSIANLKNPSIPKSFDSSGYTLDIKTKDNTGTLLESFTANPVFITGGGQSGSATTTISGVVSGNGNVLVGVTVHLMSPQTGPLDAVTDGAGLYQFTNIPVNTQFMSNNFGGAGEFMLFTEPYISNISDGDGATTTSFFGQNMPTPVQATSTSRITRNFAMTPTTGASSFAVKVTAAANTFTGAEQVDVFAGGPGQFVVQTVTPAATQLTGSTLATLSIPKMNGIWGVGFGPAMPKGTGSGFNGPPPMPNWVPPRPVEVTVSGCPTACKTVVNGSTASSYTFTISAADKTISGVLKDGSGNAIAGAMVFAFSGANGIGSNAQTSAAGVFTLKVTSGSYNVGAFSPGIGQSKEVPVVVDTSGSVYVDGSPTASTGASGANVFTLKMAKPGYSISGRVSDGTNVIGNAPVFAYRSDGTPGHAEALSDSSTGNYTLYVDSGAWVVNSSIPGFGPMTAQNVTVSGADKSNINFAPSSSQSFSILSGNIYEDTNANSGFNAGEGISGAVIMLTGASGSNQGLSGSDGAFSIRVPSGSGYSIKDIFHPTYGRIAAIKDNSTAITTINLTASTTQNIKIASRATVSVNFKDSSGNPIVVSKAFIDLFDNTTRQGNHIEVSNASSTTIQVPTGASPVIRAFIQGVPPSNVTVASDDAGTTVSSGTLTVDGTTEIVKITINTSTANLSTISGTVYKTAATAGNELDDAWIQFTDSTNNVVFGTQATSSGFYSIKASNGTYQVQVSKPGYVITPTTVTVSATTTANFVMTQADLTISGQITALGSASADSFVRAEKIGGGQAIARADTSGNYVLNVTSGSWRVYAAGEGYAETAYASNPVIVSTSATGVNVNLTTTKSIVSTVATSDTFTDTSAASFSDSTVGVGVQLDSNALGTAGNSAYLTAKETTNIPDTSSVDLIGDKAKDISAYAGGTKVSNLGTGKKATVELTYTKSELAASSITTPTGVSNLKVVSYSDDKKDWESLSTVPTYKDASGNPVASPESDLSNVSSVTFTAIGTHFSAYALSAPTGVAPPDTPSGLTATAGSAGSGRITLTWNTVSGANGYFIYRDTSSGGSFAKLADSSTGTYVDTVSNATTYYYKVSAYGSSESSESAATSMVSGIVPAASGGGPCVGCGGGGGGGGGGNYPTSASIEAASTTSAASQTSVLATALPSVSVTASAPVTVTSVSAPKLSAKFAKDLALGVKNDDVKRLQELLASDVSIYPNGQATGYFGNLTREALIKFQIKYKVISKATDGGAGKFGPKTRAKMEEVFAVLAPTASAGASVATSELPSGLIFGQLLAKGSKSADVKNLQILLNRDPDTRISESGDGSPGYELASFGRLTEIAVGKFQVKYKIANPGDAGYGVVGPKTRAKLNEMVR